MTEKKENIEKKEVTAKNVDKTTVEANRKAQEKGVSTAFQRRQQIKPCPIGAEGLCCKHCNMGPCRITAKNPVGVCGANADTIVARNFARMVAAGTSAHSDHAREVALTLKHAVSGEAKDYAIKDEILGDNCSYCNSDNYRLETHRIDGSKHENLGVMGTNRLKVELNSNEYIRVCQSCHMKIDGRSEKI